MTNEIVQQAPQEQRGALEVRQQVNQIQYLMKDVLKEGEHYGTIKGCGPKPTLLQSGAEKIAYMFHFVPTYEVERADLGHGHREYDVRCTLTQRDTGQVMGGGMGTCSTMESKYRYRWEGYGNARKRVENPDIADCWNTVLKMAKKRAFVDAVKSTTAASDIFTQDVEDMPAYMAQPVQATVVQEPEPQPQQQQQQPQQPQRDARLDKLRGLMSQAKQLGIAVRDKADPNAGLLGWVWAKYGVAADELASLSAEQIEECENHVAKVILDKQELDRQQQEAAKQAQMAEYEAAELAENDIPF